MPFLVGPETPDSPSINGPCLFPAKPVTSPYVSPNIYIGKKLVKFIHEALPPDTIAGVANNPLIPCVAPLTPALRKVVTTTNTSVFFNNLRPAVQGDATELTTVPGTKRIFVSPFQHPTIYIANGGK
jgi:hypothetical protein